MDHHNDSLALIQYIRKTIPELLQALQNYQLQYRPPGVESPAKLIYLGFFSIVLFLGDEAGELSESEFALFREVEKIFRDVEISALNPAAYRYLRRRDPAEERRISLPAVYWLQGYDAQQGSDYAETAKAMYFRFANAFIKADGRITRKEKIALSEFKELLYPAGISATIGQDDAAHVVSLNENNRPGEETPLDVALSELESLVGLDAVKNDVLQLVNFLKVQKLRESRGMAAVPVSRHLVFYGNPGTGKTTVARILSRIYKSLNIVSKGHLVETDRSGLVAGYIGQTALKVKEVVEKASGGILFVDEAYALAGEGQDFGREAINTLIKLMEDNRDDLIVVVAGYTDKMRAFLSSNPGLKSRFNRYFSFDDYTPFQLVDIFQSFFRNADFELSVDARVKALNIFQILFDVRDETFGNARLARNVFERTISNQANRVISLPDHSVTTLSTILSLDIPGEAEFTVD
jgi:SpoVK/Ycf46/Vps4 family AAA+-type ATPase